eukprot:7175665-Prorocentrum_lima.AAC.1
MGVETWAAWLQKLAECGLDEQVWYEPCRRSFQIDKQQVCTSTRAVTFLDGVVGRERWRKAWL